MTDLQVRSGWLRVVLQGKNANCTAPPPRLQLDILKGTGSATLSSRFTNDVAFVGAAVSSPLTPDAAFVAGSLDMLSAVLMYERLNAPEPGAAAGVVSHGEVAVNVPGGSVAQQRAARAPMIVKLYQRARGAAPDEDDETPALPPVEVAGVHAAPATATEPYAAPAVLTAPPAPVSQTPPTFATLTPMSEVPLTMTPSPFYPPARAVPTLTGPSSHMPLPAHVEDDMVSVAESQAIDVDVRHGTAEPWSALARQPDSAAKYAPATAAGSPREGYQLPPSSSPNPMQQHAHAAATPRSSLVAAAAPRSSLAAAAAGLFGHRPRSSIPSQADAFGDGAVAADAAATASPAVTSDLAAAESTAASSAAPPSAASPRARVSPGRSKTGHSPPAIDPPELPSEVELGDHPARRAAAKADTARAASPVSTTAGASADLDRAPSPSKKAPK